MSSKAPGGNNNYNDLQNFFNEEYHALKSYAQSRISNATDRDAEDIVQDVALKLFSKNNSLPINNIAGFVYSSLRNKIIDILRTKRNDMSINIELENKLFEFSEMFYDKNTISYSEELLKELKEAIVLLKPIYKHIIIAIDFEGYSYKEISANTGVSIGTLMSRRHRAISLLFKKLNKKENI